MNIWKNSEKYILMMIYKNSKYKIFNCKRKEIKD